MHFPFFLSFFFLIHFKVNFALDFIGIFGNFSTSSKSLCEGFVCQKKLNIGNCKYHFPLEMISFWILFSLQLTLFFLFPSTNGIQIGVGLMVFQQFCGYNGIVFYANQIFTSAGKLAWQTSNSLNFIFLMFFFWKHDMLSLYISGVPPNLGSILCACLQVFISFFSPSLRFFLVWINYQRLIP